MDALEIISPPPRRIGALALCLTMTAWLLMTMQQNAGKAAATPLAGWIVAVAMLVLCLCIIGRKLFFRESLSLARASTVSVAEADRPIHQSWEWSMSWWGLRGERLVIDTTDGRIPFGIGLSERQAAEIIGKIDALRSLRLAGPMQRPAA